MKKILFLSALLFSTTSFAKNKSIDIAINNAVAILGDVAQSTREFKVKPDQDPQSMIKEYALNEGLIDSDADFAGSWSKTNDAWEVDSGRLGLTTFKAAYGYIENGIQESWDNDDSDTKSQKEYRELLSKAKKAFDILKAIPSVSYGISSAGAVQCGVTFPSLLILDTENGQIHQVIMEGSGC